MNTYFRPWKPDDNRPFDSRAAAHLLRRTGFGSPPAEVSAAVNEGLEATVDKLFDKANDEEAEFQLVFEAAQAGFVNFADISYVQAWWAGRMLKSRVPLKEKLTLFWHGHFATSYHKVEDSYLMHKQIETIRPRACESFRDLVLAIAKDPAMLIYLDGQTNTKEHPNENFARELMELFTCGIGNYTEKDVQEAARAFTGWHRQGPEFFFDAAAHDNGRKEFLNRAGRFDGTDIIDLLMAQSATPRWIAQKLLRFFACPEPSTEVVDEAAQLLDRTQMNVKWFLRELFLSEYFFSTDCHRQRISSPAEFVVGTARTLGLRISGIEMKDHMTGMGQELFAPPNVKGWTGEQKWTNSSTWPKRRDFALTAAYAASETPFGTHLDLEAIVPSDLTEPTKVVERLNDVLLQRELGAEAKAEFAELLITTDDGPNLPLFREDAGFRNDRTRHALAALLSLPEYHVC